MDTLTFPFNHNTLQLSLQHTTIHLKLSPTIPSFTPTYTYSTKLDPISIDPKLSLIFNSTANLWKYLSFYKERAVMVDVGRIAIENELLAKSHKDLDVMRDKGEVELPVAIRLILLQDVETLIPLNGDMVVDSFEKKLARSLDDNQDLKAKLDASRSYANSLEQKIAQLQARIHSYEEETLRVFQDELPRKKIHLSDDIEQGQYYQKPEPKQIPLQTDHHHHPSNNLSETVVEESKLNPSQEAQTTEESKKISDFAHKCYLFVGFNDKSEERKGFVCIGCNKAFKDVSYLKKHLVAKHPDLAESTQRELELKLAQFKQKKDQDNKLESALKYYAAQK